jgi:hypothetical protein
MRNASWAAALAMGLAMGATAQECGPKGQPLVLVYLEDAMAVPMMVMAHAKGVAAGMFAGIGVRLEWKEGAPPRGSRKPAVCAAQADEVLEVQFEENAAAHFPQDALAYAALGRAGLCIHIFYYRVVAVESRQRPLEQRRTSGGNGKVEGGGPAGGPHAGCEYSAPRGRTSGTVDSSSQ